MTHRYDAATKTFYQDVGPLDLPPGPKAWTVDPQAQIIDLLKDIRLLLNKLVDRDPPYHSGPMTVSLPSPTPLLPQSDSKAPQGDGKVSEVPEPPK